MAAPFPFPRRLPSRSYCIAAAAGAAAAAPCIHPAPERGRRRGARLMMRMRSAMHSPVHACMGATYSPPRSRGAPGAYSTVSFTRAWLFLNKIYCYMNVRVLIYNILVVHVYCENATPRGRGPRACGQIWRYQRVKVAANLLVAKQPVVQSSSTRGAIE